MDETLNQLDDLEPQQRITQLEKQVEDLLHQIVTLQTSIVDWHSAMFAALNLILRPYRYNLEIEREHLLNLMPTRIDCLVIKKNSALPIELDAFRLFRTHNVIEMKSHGDALDIDTIWHTLGYAYQYLSLETHPGEIPPEEVTVTIIRSAFPRKLLLDLRRGGWTVEEPYHNIFYLSGFCKLPMQIVVTRDLGDVYIPLQILTDRARESDIRKFVEYRDSLTEKADRDFANAVMYACAESNREIIWKIREDEKMAGVLRELFHDDLMRAMQEGERKGKREGWKEGNLEGRREGRQEGAANTLNAVAERMIFAGRPGDEISRFTSLGRKDIELIAQRLDRPVIWPEISP